MIPRINHHDLGLTKGGEEYDKPLLGVSLRTHPHLGPPTQPYGRDTADVNNHLECPSTTELLDHRSFFISRFPAWMVHL